MRLLVHDYAGHPFQVQLSRELALRGHEVVHAFAGGLITPRGSLQRKPGDSNRIHFQEVPMSAAYRTNKYNFIKRRGYEVAYGVELAKLVKALHPDVIISGNTPTEPQWRMTSTANTLRIPIISWVQDFYSIAIEKLAREKLPLIGFLAASWYRHLDKMCLSRSAAVIVITEDFVPLLKRYGVSERNITVIPNWAPLNELPVQPRQNPWSSCRGLGDKFVFLYSGTLAMKHNPDLLQKLAARFQNDPEVRVVVVSEGPGADYLRQCKSRDRINNLELFPYQSFEEMPQVLASADVLIAILEVDAGVFSVPSKVLTYHCAKRAILSAIPAENLAARIIQCQKSGYCVGPRDFDAFVAAAVTLRHSFTLREEMARRARAYAETEFDIQQITDCFEEVFKKAIRQPITV
jgi:colanic acid biosynthesis glycosyl transferase WcaI